MNLKIAEGNWQNYLEMSKGSFVHINREEASALPTPHCHHHWQTGAWDTDLLETQKPSEEEEQS